MPFTASRALARRTERWFVRRGVPTMIEGYGFATHVLPRMLPSLALVAVASLAWLVPLRSAGSRRWVLLGAVVVATVVVRWVVGAFARRGLHLSRGVTVAILAGYALMPVAVPLLQSSRPPRASHAHVAWQGVCRRPATMPSKRCCWASRGPQHRAEGTRHIVAAPFGPSITPAGFEPGSSARWAGTAPPPRRCSSTADVRKRQAATSVQPSRR
ncbi:hypothetical protein [Phytohabitans houttuyneae]|uniref:hypothetical protein n=1 Tax=Phytohabitans houttuyneae TaxID=1076126 RepID=UPI001564065A|nr:hypothetical protein [Phytohabitans houttuyneae]